MTFIDVEIFKLGLYAFHCLIYPLLGCAQFSKPSLIRMSGNPDRKMENAVHS
jgi:hypothetical protein